MVQVRYGFRDHGSVNLPARDSVESWSRHMVQQVHQLEGNDDPVINLVKNMVTRRPEDRFSADRCLSTGCKNGLFRLLENGETVDVEESSEGGASGESITDVDTEAETEIAVVDSGNSIGTGFDDSSSDGTSTPTQRSQATRNVHSRRAPSIIQGRLWTSGEKSDAQDSSDNPRDRPSRGNGPA